MKRIVLLQLVLMMGLSSMAQSSGFEFMGIPFEVPIASFNQEMQKFDFVLCNPDQHDGTSIYKGMFEGEQAYVFVQYEPQSKVVYRAIAQITRPTKELILERYQTLCHQTETKYADSDGLKVLQTKKERFDSVMHGRAKNPYEWKSISRQNGYESTTFMIPDSSGAIQGDITLFIKESPSRDSQTTDYNLFVQYTIWKGQD